MKRSPVVFEISSFSCTSLINHISQILEQPESSISITPMSYGRVLDFLDKRVVDIHKMHSDMKLTQSKFFLCHINTVNHVQKLLLQVCDMHIGSKKIALFEIIWCYGMSIVFFWFASLWVLCIVFVLYVFSVYILSCFFLSMAGWLSWYVLIFLLIGI